MGQIVSLPFMPSAAFCAVGIWMQIRIAKRKFKMNRSKVLGLVALVSGAAANAAAIDVTATVADITAQLAPIGLVGAAVMGVFLALKAYHWVRRAMA